MAKNADPIAEASEIEMQVLAMELLQEGAINLRVLQLECAVPANGLSVLLHTHFEPSRELENFLPGRTVRFDPACKLLYACQAGVALPVEITPKQARRPITP